MSEIEKRPWQYARDYLQSDANRKLALQAGIPVAAERHKLSMQRTWGSIPVHLLDMVKTHINNERAKHEKPERSNP